MAYEEIDDTAAAYIFCLIYVILMNKVNQMYMLAVVMTQESRRRRLIQQGAIESENVLVRVGISILQGRPRRSYWMQVRNRDWWERVVLKEFTDEQWKENFRMTRKSFDKLCGLMSAVVKPRRETVRRPVPLPMRVAIVLYKLAGGANYRVVAERFGVQKSTVHTYVNMFCKGMVSSVVQHVIRVPAEEEAAAIARRFERKFHIPQVIGCMDCTHIPIKPPSDCFKHFLNREGWPSYVLQVVVDDTYRFWSIHCQQPGSAHNAQVLRKSALFSHKHVLPGAPRDINGVSVKPFLLGHPAYPLKHWLMKEYINSPHITPEQELFNGYLSSARTTVEIALERLKSRWQVLLKQGDFHFTFTPYVVATCCALHNFCEDEEEVVNPIWTAKAAVLESDLPQPDVHAYSPTNNAVGKRIREALTDYLSANFPQCATKQLALQGRQHLLKT